MINGQPAGGLHPDQLRFFYWIRIVGGVTFLIGQFTYFASFFIGGAHVLSDDAAPAIGGGGILRRAPARQRRD